MATCQQNDSARANLHDVCNAWEIKEIAEAMMENGMQEAGYNYINLDDCWQSPIRASDGQIQEDLSRFPDGIKELANWLHERNFKFGIYVSAGIITCSSGGRYVPIVGSYGYYEQDAMTLASWGVDYVKFDWCGTTLKNGTQLDQQTQTTQMTMALNKTGRPMWFNFHCGNPPQAWCRNDGNSFRIGGDHHDNWGKTAKIIETLGPLGNSSGPGYWNDPDFLMTGGAGCDDFIPGNHCPGMTETEYKTEFSLWVIATAPLIVSTDVRRLTDFQREVLLNRDLLNVHWDAKATAGSKVATMCTNNACEIWTKPLVGSQWAVALFNGDKNAQNMTLDFQKILKLPSNNALVYDLWKHENLGVYQSSFTAFDIPSHGTVAVKVTPI
eukprot:CAMPEP_0174250438 /NCGR_PEP_ID=MMETSP0439-20130205/607_1 /TAXON_ID=0 /ORGANISM="Stereomyxa ramosa, Strain Chinc5" /LENGTH=382 /DNA_ID=CAMNT_0015330505 /DNA_START=119 /DNA_END=1267 /DNA_ORIENTATION=+